MEVPLNDLRAQYSTIGDEIQREILRVCRSQEFTLGPEVDAFEKEFSSFCGVRFAQGCNSGTSALHLALMAVGVGPGDEVITTPHTFIATAEAVSMVGAKPVFCDVDPKTFNLDPNQVANALSSKTKAIIPVHIYGLCTDVPALRNLVSDVFIIEDAAQAHGASIGEQKAGALGHLGTFSFYPGKNLGAFGDAGAVVTNSDEYYRYLKLYCNHGRVDKYEHIIVGNNYRLHALQAAVLRVKLKKLKNWTERRQQVAEVYLERLRDLPIQLPFTPAQFTHVYHVFSVLSDRRDELRQYLMMKGIQTGVHYPIPLHLQIAYKDLNYKRGSFPTAEKVANTQLSLPMFPEITNDQVHYVCDILHGYFR